ncbi:MAG TPA: NTPase [candidate division Zixibacteria bacterium]|nr:NTPase [candidate division Zixibacteria bacterium]
MRKRVFLLTGSPGVGKTTVILRIVESLKAKGYNVGGMVSREVRAGRDRVGFEILNVNTGRKGWLAHVVQKEGPKVGRYRVNIGDLESIGVEAITSAVATSDVIVIDEIGPMELHSKKFREAVLKAAESLKLLVGVVHWKATDTLINIIKDRDDAEVHVVTVENRENLPVQVLGEAVVFLSGTARE